MNTINVSLVGVGGQGIILTADLLAKAAAYAGRDVKKSEIHGMAQRGGSVMSQVRFGECVDSPIIQEGTADILVAFDKVEALRNVGILTKGATAIVNDLYLVPVTVSSGLQKAPADLDTKIKRTFKSLVLLDAVKIATEKVGNPRTMNMVIAGALSAFCPFKADCWYKAMTDILSGPKAKLLDINKKAFGLGREAVGASAK